MGHNMRIKVIVTTLTEDAMDGEKRRVRKILKMINGNKRGRN